MQVLVDTPVWSLALRRKPRGLSSEENEITRNLADLIQEGRARIIGPIRQELLSGVREEDQFQKLRRALRAFDEPLLQPADYEEAAHMNDLCRRHGISGSAVDYLICAVARRHSWAIFTLDLDFRGYERILSVQLFRPLRG
ncbi:MAG: PIN domain-containing protein [Acidobacteria bacterium]|nr:PIN domain-containing protein [Acidobacteriota bacterium]